MDSLPVCLAHLLLATLGHGDYVTFSVPPAHGTVFGTQQMLEELVGWLVD